MNEKMYDNLQEKYKNSIFQILKVCKIRTLKRLVILILIRQSVKNTLGCAIVQKRGHRKVFVKKSN